MWPGGWECWSLSRKVFWFASVACSAREERNVFPINSCQFLKLDCLSTVTQLEIRHSCERESA